MSNKVKNPNFSKTVLAVQNHYSLLAQQAQKNLYESAEYVNWKHPKAGEIQARADDYLAKKEALDLQVKELEKVGDALRKECGLSSYWRDSEDMTTLGEYYTAKEKSKHFSDRTVSSWVSSERVNDTVRQHLLNKSVEEIATMLFKNEDVKAIEKAVIAITPANREEVEL
jgi:hypothetical protein